MVTTCRDEVLCTVRILTKEKGSDEFTVPEVLKRMKSNNSVYPEVTISTHIRSKCCSNSPKNHAITFNDYERVSYGLYRLINK